MQGTSCHLDYMGAGSIASLLSLLILFLFSSNKHDVAYSPLLFVSHSRAQAWPGLIRPLFELVMQVRSAIDTTHTRLTRHTLPQYAATLLAPLSCPAPASGPLFDFLYIDALGLAIRLGDVDFLSTVPKPLLRYQLYSLTALPPMPRWTLFE